MSTDVDKLKQLRQLYDEGFIEKSEYDSRRLSIITGDNR
jgi:hypothetical protein